MLFTIVLIHDVRSIAETKQAHTISVDRLVRISRYRETGLGGRTDLKVTIRLLNEADAAGIELTAGIDDEGLVMADGIAVLIVPSVGKAIRRDTGHLCVVTAVLGLDMRVRTIDSKVRVCVVTRPAAVHRSETHLDGLAVIRHEVDTDGGPILPCCTIPSNIPTRLFCIRISKVRITASLINQLSD